MTVGGIRVECGQGRHRMNESAVAFILWPKICPLGAFSCHRMDVGAVLFILWNTTIVGKRLKRGKPIKVGRGANLIVFGEIVQKG